MKRKLTHEQWMQCIFEAYRLESGRRARDEYDEYFVSWLQKTPVDFFLRLLARMEKSYGK